MDIIFIRSLELAAVIGVYEAERKTAQRLVVDLELGFDTRRPAVSDNVAQTLDYQQIASDIDQYVGSSKFYLVESLANALAARLLARYPIENLKLTLTKPDVMAPDVGVRIYRESDAL